MPTKSYFSSRIVREASSRLSAAGAQMEITLPRELVGVISSTKKSRSELKAAFEAAFSRLRKD
ncbi:MAG TPA: hypothetical protein VJS90_13420 [Pseudomonas sp.]|uniref:hypothetical protein n=1 Tax=Pseudomonas sp. TaxID=306 RepID=UPI002B459908|nr:hypothetical protein [Pseudomonas sp.]HKS14026.1 hypothetical protein [Pseudomonas sp.]